MLFFLLSNWLDALYLFPATYTLSFPYLFVKLSPTPPYSPPSSFLLPLSFFFTDVVVVDGFKEAVSSFTLDVECVADKTTSESSIPVAVVGIVAFVIVAGVVVAILAAIRFTVRKTKRDTIQSVAHLPLA